MRLSSITITAFLCLFLIGASQGQAQVDIRILNNTPNQTVINYRFGEFSKQYIRIEGKEYVALRLGQESIKKEVGKPALPDVSRSIIIPDMTRMKVVVRDSSYYEIQNVNVVPSKGFILRTVNPADVPYSFGRVYGQDAYYPAKLAQLREPYILRDYRGVVVTVNPFQYNPIRGILRIYTEMTVAVSTAGPGKTNVLQFRDHNPKILRSFHQIYGNHFINYSQASRYDPLDEDGEMLIIAHDDWLGNLASYITHKNSVGIQTTLVGVSTIGNTATNIKNYIQTFYDSPNNDLSFVLLVGDYAQVTSMSASGGASDPSYAKLAGGDDYPEIFVGRFSAENLTELDTQTLRTIEYESLPAPSADWFWRGMGVASDQGPGDDGELDYEHLDNIRVDLLAYGYSIVDQIYDPTATAAQVTDGINAGRGIVNYTGHGGPTSWGTTGFSNSNVNALTNDNMLPFIVTVACNNGEFDSYTCFCEAWLRATNDSEPTGAIGMYGSSISQSWDPPMCSQDEIVDRYVDQTYTTLGALCFAGSCQMMDEYGSGGVSMFDTWILFGDPSLRVTHMSGLRVSPGSGLSAEGPNGGPFTPDSIVYTLTNLDPGSIIYSITKNQDWIDLSDTGGIIPVGGQKQVTVSINGLVNDFENGHYDDIVEFINTSNHDGDTSRVISLDVGVPQPVHVMNLDYNPGWITSGEWSFGQPTGSGGTSYGNPDPTSGASGNNVFGVNLSGDYSTALGGPYYVTSNALDCSSLIKVSLHYKRWLNTDYPPYVNNKIEVSTDGTTWTSIWQNPSGSVTDNAWVDQEFDISTLADGQATVYIRWSHEIGSSGCYAYSGWNIDDVEIWGVPTGASVPTLSLWGILVILLTGTFFLGRSKKG